MIQLEICLSVHLCHLYLRVQDLFHTNIGKLKCGIKYMVTNIYAKNGGVEIKRIYTECTTVNRKEETPSIYRSLLRSTSNTNTPPKNGDKRIYTEWTTVNRKEETTSTYRSLLRSNRTSKTCQPILITTITDQNLTADSPKVYISR